MPQYLDDNGNPVAPAAKTYLDDSGNPVSSSPPAPRTSPEERSFGNYASEGVRGVGRGLVNDVKGLAALRHPIDAVTDFAKQVNESGVQAGKEFRDTAGAPIGQRIGAAALTGLENAPVIGGAVQHAEEGGEQMGSPEAFGAAMEGVTTLEAPGAAGKLAPRLVRPLVGDAPRAIRDLVDKTKEGNAKATEKAADQTAKDRESVDVANQKATAARSAEVQKHFEKSQAADQAATAQKQLASRKSALQTGVRKLSDKFQEDLKARRDTAAEAADAKYKNLNAVLGELPADGEFLPNALVDASEKIRGSETEPAIFRDIEKKVGRGESFSYSDLQGYYSEIGRELKKGTLPGDVYTAYNTMQESIGNEMQRIASSKGMGAQLLDARTSWRNLKQTFYDPKSPLKKALAAKEPGGAIKALAGKDRTGIEALAKFDPELARRANTIRGYHAQAEAIRVPTATPKAAPGLAPRPEPTAYAEPRVPETTKISSDDISKAKAGELRKRADRLRNIGEAASVWQLLRGRFVTAAGGYAASNILENPKVASLLTKATARDVAMIPPELRGDLPRIVSQAKANGIKVSPFLERVTQGYASIAPRTQGNATDDWATQ